MKASPIVRRPGATPRAPLIQDQSSPSTADAAEGNSSLDQPPIIRISPNLQCILEAEAPYLHHAPETEKSRGWPPVQRLHEGSPSSTGSPATPERSATRTRKSPRGLIPSQRRRCRRLAADAGKPNPRFTRTYPTTPANRREHSGLPHLPTALEPSEAEGTASSAGGDSAAPIRPSQL